MYKNNKTTAQDILKKAQNLPVDEEKVAKFNVKRRSSMVWRAALPMVLCFLLLGTTTLAATGRLSTFFRSIFKDEKTAEEQVVQVLNFNIHLVKDFRGRRYIERITECVPVEEKNEYTFNHRNEKTLEGKLDKFFDNAAIFFSKTTNRELYKYHNILEFSNDSYILTNPISETNIREMRNNMDEGDVVKFDAFLERVWGIKPPKQTDYVYEEEELGKETKNEETIQVVATPVEEEKNKLNTNEVIRKVNSEAKSTNTNANTTNTVERITSKNSARQMSMRRQVAEAARRATQGKISTEEKMNPTKNEGISSILNGIDLNDKENKDEE